MNRPPSLVLLFLASLLPGCQGSPPADREEPTGPVLFRDVTEEVGLHFVHDPGPLGSYFMPQIVGSGAALFDYDNDGLLDIYLVQNAGPGSKSTNRLFHHEKDGRFRDVSAGSGLDVAGHGMGVAIGDVNNDGLPDVLVTQYGGSRLNTVGTGPRGITWVAGSGRPKAAASGIPCFPF